MVQRPSTHSTPAGPPLKNAFFWGRQLLDDCCMFLLNSDHLRPTLILSLNFLMGVCSAPKTGEPPALSAHPALDTLHGYIGSRCAMSWWHHWPTHGGKGQICWGQGDSGSCWLLCILCFVSILLATNDTYFVESWYRISQNGQLCTLIDNNAPPNHPNYKTASKP